MKCPKCEKMSDIQQEATEIVFEVCGHTFDLDYMGYYDFDQKFHIE